MSIASVDFIACELIAAIEAGSTFHGFMRTVNADLLRAILLGISVPLPKQKDSSEFTERRVIVRTSGIRIESAKILGRLDLDDLSGPGGGPLPRLWFQNCVFEDKEGINIRRCHLRSLTLIDCQLHELQGAEAVIDGPVKIRGIKRPEKRSIGDRTGNKIDTWGTYVVLRGAQIAGHVDCGKSNFAATPRDEGDRFVPQSRHARFALDLRAARINGSILLRPDVKAVGGISVTLAQIQGSIWCQGADLVAIEDCAFSADYATVQGSVYLRARDRKDGDSVRFSAWGQVSLFAAKIGGSFYMEGANLQLCPPFENMDGDEQFESVDATNATIGGNCRFSCWRSVTNKEIVPFAAEGTIALDSAVIRSGLYMAGASVRKVSAANVEIGGKCDMSAYEDSSTSTQPAKRCPRFTATTVRLEGAVIKGDWLMLGALLQKTEPPRGDTPPDDDECGIFARGAKIGGDCQFGTFPYHCDSARNEERFECYGRIAIPEATIGNSLGLAGAKLDLKEGIQYAAVDISGTTIGGHAKLWTWKHRDRGNCIRLEIKSSGTGVRMVGTKIAQTLSLNGATITAARYAIYAPNLEVTGKASLSTFPEDDPESCKPDEETPSRTYSFTAMGTVLFTAASFKLGLDMRGASLCLQPARTCNGDIVRMSTTRALDLTLVRAKFVELTRTRHKRYPIRFSAAGEVSLEHAQVETDVDLSRGRFQGRLVADYARIGVSLKLTKAEFWSSTALEVYEMKRSEWRNLEAKTRQKQLRNALAVRHARRLGNPEISLRSAVIGGDLRVEDPRAFQRFRGAAPARFPWKVLKQFSYITVDLRGLQVEQLNDRGGDGWMSAVLMWLDGFSCARLAPYGPKMSREGRKLTRPRWARKLVIRPIAWLELQYFDPKNPRVAEVTPGAYEQVVKVLNADGQYGDADRVSCRLITNENQVSHSVSRKILGFLFGLFFRYGTSPRRALLWLVFFLLVGMAGAYVADFGMNWYGKGPTSLDWIGKCL